MTSLLWVVPIWVGAYLLTRTQEAEPGEDRLRLALAVGMLAIASISQGASADEIARDPVGLERALRGSLAGLSLVVAAPVLIQQGRTLLTRPLPASTLFYFYGAVAAVSSLYSVAPVVTAAKAGELLIGLTIVLGFAILPNPLEVIRRGIDYVLYAIGGQVGLAVVGYFVLPGTFSRADTRPGFITDQVLTSPYMHSNGLSFAGAVFASFMLVRLLRLTDSKAQWLAGSGGFLGVAAVALSSGRQGLLILVATVVLILLVIRPQPLTLWLLPVAVGSAVYAWESIVRIFVRGQNEELVFTLSGRTHWWASALEAWTEAPLTGFGFGTGGRFVALQRIGRGEVSSVHSGYIESLVSVGLLGFIPLMIVFGMIAWFSLTALRRELQYAMLITPLAIHAFISLGFGGWWSLDVLLLALLAAWVDVSRLKDEKPYSTFTGQQSMTEIA